MATVIFRVVSALLLSSLVVVGRPILLSAESKSSWQVEWENTVKAAETEGAVVIYSTEGLDLVFREALQKKYPKIKVMTVMGRGSQLGQRIMVERRAGKYIADLCVTGFVTPLSVFYRGKILDPIKPLLILPEVVEPSNWFQGKHHYVDSEGRYIFMFEGTARSGEITYNTKLVNQSEIRSYWDLLDSKWKGKIVAMDPLAPGPIGSAELFFYKHPDLGPEFLRRLFAETNITIVRSDEQLLDWVGLGRFPLGFGARAVSTAIKQGLPVNQFLPGHMKEGASLAAYNGTLSFFTRAPHPNAAKVAVNWLLSREGQSTWLDYNHRAGSSNDSLREDISREKVAEVARRVKEGSYLVLKAEWMDELDTIRKLIRRALAGAGKSK
jgi:ABC-type Fe3+ transport system substrate-binding protein